MAKKKTVVEETPQSTKPVIHQITIRNVDRTQKDIADYRAAHQAAESVYYPNRSRLYDMFDDILLDTHLAAIIDKRIDTVLNHPLWFEVNSKKDETFDDELINTVAFRKMLKEIMQQKFWGITGFEFQNAKEFTFDCIPRKHIKTKTKIISFEQSGETGIPYEPLKNIWVLGDDYDFGILLKCAYCVLYKRNNLSDWAQYIELFGMPTRVAKYDGNDVNTKVQLQQAINEAGSALAIMIPKQADLEFKDGKASNGDGQLQNRFHDILNAEMSKLILGNTQTTESSGGGDAQTKEHGKQQDEKMKSDLIDVALQLNSKHFKDIVRSYGFTIPETGAKFVFEPLVDEYESAARMAVDKQFPAPLGDEYFYKYYKRPKPDNYDELKAQQEAERLAKIAHMNSSGLKPDKNGNPDPADNVDDSDGKENDLRNKGGKKAADANAHLTQWQKFRASLADFFDHGHND